jgi:hypothetical protein
MNFEQICNHVVALAKETGKFISEEKNKIS